MSHPVYIPDDLYSAVASFAQQQGQTVDALIEAWARDIQIQEKTHAAQPAESADAPDESVVAFLKIAGSLDSGIPNLAEHHDAYLSQVPLAQAQGLAPSPRTSRGLTR